jgi:hypothetical protein
MKTNIYKKIVMLIFLITLPHAVYADPLSYALESWDPVGVCGNIMGTGKDYIIVNEQKILIINENRQGKKFKTFIMNMEDKQLKVDALKKGGFVAINGSRSKGKDLNDVVVAKEIYVLPRSMSSKEMKKYSKLQHPVEPW